MLKRKSERSLADSTDEQIPALYSTINRLCDLEEQVKAHPEQEIPEDIKHLRAAVYKQVRILEGSVGQEVCLKISNHRYNA